MFHFSQNQISTPVQHGFRSKQILNTTDKFIQNFESKTQTDVVVLDFSEAFDVVPHQRLLHKLDHYGIRGTILNPFVTRPGDPRDLETLFRYEPRRSPGLIA